jgi:hypothetical protein
MPAEHLDLDERALVQQHLEPFAGGALANPVLPLHRLLAAGDRTGA